MSETMPALTEDDIRALASPQSFERGFNYFHNDALFDTRQVGNDLRGYCHGSGYTPYRVSAQLGLGGVITAHCTCPYDWGGICKHIIALLLAWVHTPDVFRSVAPTDERLTDKSKEELIALIQEMLKREPDSATRQLWFEVLLEAELMEIQMGGIDLAYPAGDILVEHTNAEEWNRVEERVRQMIASLDERYSSWKRETLVNFLAQRLKIFAKLCI